MKKKILHTLSLVFLFASIVSVSFNAAAADLPSSRTASDRSGFRSERASSAFSQGPKNAPSPGGAVGTTNMEGGSEAPVGDATGIILLAGLAYVGFVFIRKRTSELKV